ncbi:MAG: TlpA family protein disulfide reductase [Acidimicrobiales bacterium]
MVDHNFQVIAVAIDENVEKVREFMDGITYPVLMDTEHLLTELYAISNVPSVLLIDEHDRIVQPNWNAYATNTFKDYTGIESADHVEAIRRWVIDGTPMMSSEDAKVAVGDLSPAEEQARLHFRIANHLRALGDEAGADRNFDQAGELAPHDWTIRRAMMPLRGQDPFGEEFFALAAEYTKAGRPFHGVAQPRSQ